MKRYMIDPPEGWKFGFPKVVPLEHTLWSEDEQDQWLFKNGYPKEIRAAYGKNFHVRYMEFAEHAPTPSPAPAQRDGRDKVISDLNREIRDLRIENETLRSVIQMLASVHAS